MGLVFKATRESDGAVVALKVMRFELIEDPVFGRRFEQEARAAAEVTEPHLVPVLEAGQADGRRFLASKYIDGKTLDEMLDDGPLELADTAKYTQHVGGRAAGAARGGHRPPRPQAVEHHHRLDRHGDAHRLRPREGPRLHRADQARPGDGHARLPRARAGEGRAGDARDRHLRARLHGLRVRRRPAAVRATRRASRSASRTSPSRRRRSRSSATTSRPSSRRPCSARSRRIPPSGRRRRSSTATASRRPPAEPPKTASRAAGCPSADAQ